MRCQQTKELNQKYLKSLLNYDPETGVFTWLVSRGPIKAGATAGSPDSKGYIRVKIDQKLYGAHRLAFLYMTGEWPEESVDHIDGNIKHNSWSNLRDVSLSGNSKNQKLRSDNLSGVPGVGWREEKGKWRARIHYEGKEVTLGHFLTKEEAIKVRKLAEIRFGYHQNHGRVDETSNQLHECHCI